MESIVLQVLLVDGYFLKVIRVSLEIFYVDIGMQMELDNV